MSRPAGGGHQSAGVGVSVAGHAGRVIELAGDREVQLLTSRALLDELAVTLARRKWQVRGRHRP